MSSIRSSRPAPAGARGCESFRTPLLALVLALATPLVTGAQAPSRPAAPPPAAAVDAPRPNKVFFSGENPWIGLREKPDAPTSVTVASFWRIHWSPVGAGHVCFITVGEANTPGAVRVALHDNERLLRYLTDEVLGTFNKSYVERPFTPIGGATFASSGDAKTEWRETCKSDKYDVELVWRDMREPGLVDIPAGSRPTNPFGITYLRIPAGRAEVRINGKPAPGASIPEGSFLAFGETWIK